jgi:hypothetical protein
MNTETFYKIFNEAELAYTEKFGEPPTWHGWSKFTPENLQAIDKAIRTNTPISIKDPSEGGKKLILT